MSFLIAEWKKLVLANYVIEPAILKPYLPYKTELDLWKDRCYVSLVGFMFLNTRLLGLPIPFHRNFEEVNLRFYVRYKAEDGWRRGVVFIKELVPKPALSFVANTVYKEHYQTVPMKHRFSFHEAHQEIGYSWKSKGMWQSVEVKAGRSPQAIAEASDTEFITEHYYGYTKLGPKKTSEYQVTHPRWEAYTILEHDIQVDFAKVYGDTFGFLNQEEPASVMLAEGSEITVENKRIIQ